jgi:ribonuclease P protein component
MSLPKTYRLRRRQDFQQVYQKGRRRTGTHLSVTVLPRPRSLDGPTARPLAATCFGISIGKKVSKKAVVRNLIKRRIKGALRQFIGQSISQILPGKMVVIICKPSIIGCDYDEILRELEKLLLTLEVMNGHQGNNLL